MTIAVDDSALRAWAYLSRVAEPPCAELAALVQCVGPVEAADRVRRGLVNDDLAHHIEARRGIDRAAEDLELLARRGGRLITPDGDEWPLLAFAAFGGAGGPEATARIRRRARESRPARLSASARTMPAR
jgi:DNA processing protein